MSRRALWGAWLAALALLVAVPGVLAAPAEQDAPPDEAVTPTPDGANGQVVEAERLIVRAGASTDWRPIGGLDEGEPVRILGVSPDGRWLLIDYNGRQGWVSADYVAVDPEAQLPVAPPPTAQPVTPSPTPTETPEPTDTPEPTATPTDRPSPTPEPTETEEPTATATPTVPEVAAVAPAPGTGGQDIATTPTPITPGGGPLRALDLPRETLGWATVAAAVLLLVLTIYLARRGRRKRELMRYRHGFVLQECPVCQRGALQLDERVQRVFGVLVVKRTVRCDTCRSVLRQVRPNRWRYTMDPHANPALAAEYNGQDFTDAQLVELADIARQQYEPPQEEMPVEPVSPTFEEAVEHLAELEASVLAESVGGLEVSDGPGLPVENGSEPDSSEAEVIAVTEGDEAAEGSEEEG